MDTRCFEDEFKNACWSQMWRFASKHHLGQGVQDGVNIKPAQRLFNSLQRKGSIIEAGLLQCIVCAGIWTNDRLSKHNYSNSALCPLCKVAEDTEFRRAYECLSVLQSDHEDIVSTNYLVSVAKHNFILWPCFWLRGLIPVQWYRNLGPARCVRNGG